MSMAGGQINNAGAEGLVGPCFQLPSSAPSSREGLSTVLWQWGSVAGLWAVASEPLCPQVTRLGRGCKHTQEGDLFTVSLPPLPGGGCLAIRTKEPFVPGLTVGTVIPATGQGCRRQHSFSRALLSFFFPGLAFGGWRPRRFGVLILAVSRSFHPSSFI